MVCPPIKNILYRETILYTRSIVSREQGVQRTAHRSDVRIQFEPSEAGEALSKLNPLPHRVGARVSSRITVVVKKMAGALDHLSALPHPPQQVWRLRGLDDKELLETRDSAPRLVNSAVTSC